MPSLPPTPPRRPPPSSRRGRVAASRAACRLSLPWPRASPAELPASSPPSPTASPTASSKAPTTSSRSSRAVPMASKSSMQPELYPLWRASITNNFEKRAEKVNFHNGRVGSRSPGSTVRFSHTDPHNTAAISRGQDFPPLCIGDQSQGKARIDDAAQTPGSAGNVFHDRETRQYVDTLPQSANRRDNRAAFMPTSMR